MASMKTPVDSDIVQVSSDHCFASEELGTMLTSPTYKIPQDSSVQRSDKVSDTEKPFDGETKPGEHFEGKKGAKIETQNLYATSDTYCSCCINWEPTKPYLKNDEKLTKLKQGQDEYAIVRRQKAHGGNNGWKTHSIVINSPLLKSVLAGVFAGYPSVDAQSLEPTFEPDFVPFVHMWDEILARRSSEADTVTRDHLRLLVETLEPEVAKPFGVLRYFNESLRLPFEWLHLAFRPGEVIVRNVNSTLSAGILRDIRRGEDDICFTVATVDWNGVEFGVLEVQWNLSSYQGSMEVPGLRVSPLSAHPDRNEIEKALMSRGRVFEDLAGHHVKQYAGMAVQEVDYGFFSDKIERMVVDRVVIDARAYYNLQDRQTPEMELLGDLEHVRPARAQYAHDAYDDFHPSRCLPRITQDRHIQHEAESAAGIPAKLTDRQCIFTSAKVKGFALHEKIWCEIFVKDVRDPVWQDDALSRLIIGENEKALLVALMSFEKHQKAQSPHDVISNKGRGVVVLLSGPPGVGKTMTAECLAEHLRKPLYRFGAGDTGRTGHDIEQKLRTALARCTRWNAVLLIDEADVFLETRSKNDLQRNELVSVFLRLLEYYPGLMILTTNRIDAIDPAFESRIDISLAYNDLDRADRAKIWRELLSGPDIYAKAFGDAEFDKLAQVQLNGRQIASAVKTAKILAAHDNCALNVGHLDIVIDIRSRARSLMTVGAVEHAL